VRRQYLAMFRETLDYGADGIAVVFNRNFPFVGWEDPVVRSFRARFHLDPRSLGPRDDEKFFQHQAEYVTTFLREIRALLDEYGGKRRERLQLAVEIGGNPPAFPYQPAIPDLRRSVLEFGWDVRTWIAAGSIDALILHPWSQLEVTEEETRVLSGWTRGSQVKFYVDFFPEQLDPEGIRAATLGYYAAGADGLCFWNTDLRVKRPGQWAMWRLLGHRRDLPEWQSFAQRLFRVVPLKSLAGRAFGSK